MFHVKKKSRLNQNYKIYIRATNILPSLCSRDNFEFEDYKLTGRRFIAVTSSLSPPSSSPVDLVRSTRSHARVCASIGETQPIIIITRASNALRESFAFPHGARRASRDSSHFERMTRRQITTNARRLCVRVASFPHFRD